MNPGSSTFPSPRAAATTGWSKLIRMVRAELDGAQLVLPQVRRVSGGQRKRCDLAGRRRELSVKAPFVQRQVVPILKDGSANTTLKRGVLQHSAAPSPRFSVGTNRGWSSRFVGAEG